MGKNAEKNGDGAATSNNVVLNDKQNTSSDSQEDKPLAEDENKKSGASSPTVSDSEQEKEGEQTSSDSQKDKQSSADKNKQTTNKDASITDLLKGLIGHLEGVENHYTEGKKKSSEDKKDSVEDVCHHNLFTWSPFKKPEKGRDIEIRVGLTLEKLWIIRLFIAKLEFVKRCVENELPDQPFQVLTMVSILCYQAKIQNILAEQQKMVSKALSNFVTTKKKGNLEGALEHIQNTVSAKVSGGNYLSMPAEGNGLITDINLLSEKIYSQELLPERGRALGFCHRLVGILVALFALSDNKVKAESEKESETSSSSASLLKFGTSVLGAVSPSSWVGTVGNLFHATDNFVSMRDDKNKRCALIIPHFSKLLDNLQQVNITGEDFIFSAYEEMMKLQFQLMSMNHDSVLSANAESGDHIRIIGAVLQRNIGMLEEMLKEQQQKHQLSQQTLVQ